MSTSYSQPSVPSLYLETHSSNDDTTSINDNGNNNENNNSTTPELPSELLSLCLASYANWGDLAKLACVQKSWSNIVMDTANQSSTSQWELAMALLNGDCGLEETPKRAVQILKALSNIAIDESTGKPLTVPEENNSKIIASEETSAMRKIAECYLEGTGVPQDAAVAVSWMETAYYIGNDSDAAHEMAVIYEYGRHGVEIDVVAAAEWFERSAKLGNVESMVELGLCFELGAGVEQNDEEALDWYTKAANLGCATGKFSVGEIFEEARGVPQSDAEACLWYYSAAMDGCQDSKIALRRLYAIARIVVPGVTAILNE